MQLRWTPAAADNLESIGDYFRAPLPKEPLRKSAARVLFESTISMKRMAHFQQTLASQASFEKHGRKSKRKLFLDQMNQVLRRR